MSPTLTGTATINGKAVGDVKITFSGTAMAITHGVAQPGTPPVPVPPPPPVPQPTPAPPAGNWSGRTIEWAHPGGRQTLDAVGTTPVIWQFTTTSNPDYAGDITVAETTGYEGVTRRLWISETPGGPVVGGLNSQGNSLRKLRWAQGFSFMRTRLKLGHTYYLNLQNTQGCTGRCGFHINFGTNGKA